MNDLSCGVRKWAQVFFVFSQSTRLTDGRIALHYMQSHGKNPIEAVSVLRVQIRLEETGVPCATRQWTWFCKTQAC